MMQLQHSLPPLLSEFLRDKRWFGGKARGIRSIEIEDIVPVEQANVATAFVFARIEYESGPPEIYVLPLLARVSSANGQERGAHSDLDDVVVELPLSDALQNEEVLRSLYDVIKNKAVLRGFRGEIHGSQTTSFLEISLPAGDTSKPKVITGEQSNSSSIFGKRSILKVFRRVQEGVNPELEVGRFLTETARFPHIPPLGGSLEYVTNAGARMTLSVLQGFVANDGDAWQYTLESLSAFWRDAPDHSQEISADTGSPKAVSVHEARAPAVAQLLCGPYLDAMALLGQRTAELHKALASDKNAPAFAPEPFTAVFQRKTESALTASALETFALLRSQVANLSREPRAHAERVLEKENEVLQVFRDALSRPLSGLRTRIHGDYHLGQVLCAAGDFAIIDFEGEPGRPISDRVVKRSPLQDVAGMLRSFHYAAFGPLLAPLQGMETPKGEDSQLAILAEAWNGWVSSRFLKAYFENARTAGFLPEDDREISSLLRLHLVSKALFELSYELNNRPEWVKIPLVGILRLLEHPNQSLL
jgi:trehalose synthase-fused probable maltokinase